MITGTEFNVDYQNDKDVLIHRSPLLDNGLILDGLFDYLKMEDFPEQDLDSIFTLDVSLNVYSNVAGIITLLDTRNTITNKGLVMELNVATKKIQVTFFISTSVFASLELFNIPFISSKRHNIAVCYNGEHPINGLTIYFDGVILTSVFNPFGNIVITNNITTGTIINGENVGYIGRKNLHGSPENSKAFVLKSWILAQGIYTKQTSRKSFNTGISSLPNYLVDLETNKTTGVPITDNEVTVTITQYGGNTYTPFIS